MDALIQKKTNRFRLLNLLYERTDGNKQALEDMWAIGRELNLTRDETQNAVDYLVGEDLATHRAIGGAIAMTHAGVRQVEQALSKPEAPTEYFPPVVNILNVHNMVRSLIQQGTHGSTQSQTVSQNDLSAVSDLLMSIKSSIANLSLGHEAHREAESEIQTVEAQLKSSKPKIAIIRESLNTLRSLIEGVASNALAAAILPLFAPVAVALGF